MQADLAKFDRVFFVMWGSAFLELLAHRALDTAAARFPTLAAPFWSCSRIALWTRRRRRRSQRKERLRSFLSCSLRSLSWRCGAASSSFAANSVSSLARQDSGAPLLLRRRAIPDARSAFSELLAHRALDPPPSSSLAEERTPPLVPPPCDGARFPTLAAQCVVTPLALSQGCGLIALYTSPYLTPAG